MTIKHERERLSALMEIYRQSVYEARTSGGNVALRIGKKSPALERLCRSHGMRSALYITAWNPGGLPRVRAANVRINCELERDLQRLSEHVWYGAGRSRDGSWEEESFLALGISLRDSRRLGRKYRQVAIVWAGRTGVPRIVKTM